MRTLLFCIFLSSAGLVAKACELYVNRFPTTKFRRPDDCIEGYFRDWRGFREDLIIPTVVFNRTGALNFGETGAKVTVKCLPSDRGEGAYNWTLDGNRVHGVHTSTYSFTLGSGSNHVECDFPQYSDISLRNFAKNVAGRWVYGYESLEDSYFRNEAEGVPNIALPGTLMDVTCSEIPWTRQPLNVSWRIYNDVVFFGKTYAVAINFETHGDGLYALNDVEMTAENEGNFVTCQITSLDTKRVFSARIPQPFETDIPDIHIEEGDRFASTGQSVSFTCGFQSQSLSKRNDDITWSWYRNDIVQPGLTTSDIVLTSVSKGTHDGEWKCKAQYLERPIKESAPVHLRIDSTLHASLVIEAFSLMTTIHSYTRVVRCEVTFDFDVPFDYAWSVNGSVVPGLVDNVLNYYNAPDQLRCIASVDLMTATSNAVILNTPASQRDLSEYVCPESFQFSGQGDLGEECECRQGYQLQQYGCRAEPIIPRVELDGTGISTSGETGARVTVKCMPSNLGNGRYLWTKNDVPVDGVIIFTYTFHLAQGVQDIRCQIQQYDEYSTSQPLRMTGYDNFVDAPVFENEVIGVPDTALPGTLLNLVCDNIPLPRQSFEIRWASYATYVESGEVVPNGTTFETQGLGMYKLRNFEINAQNAGNYVTCQILFPQSRGNSTPIFRSRIPAQLETDIPNIQIEEGDRFALTGQSVTFSCSFQGQLFFRNENITWSWYRNDILQDGLTTSEIILDNVSEDTHEGRWMCKAQYQDRPAKESDSVSLILDWTIRPVLRTFAIASVSVIYQCAEFLTSRSAITYWPHSYSWTRNGEVLDGYCDNILLVSSQDTGVYSCTIHADFLSGTSGNVTAS